MKYGEFYGEFACLSMLCSCAGCSGDRMPPNFFCLSSAPSSSLTPPLNIRESDTGRLQKTPCRW